MLLQILMPLLLAFPSAAFARGVVHLPSDTTVEGSVITLGEIATLDGLAPEAQARFSAITLGPAAAPSRHRTFSGQALRERLAALDPDVVLDVANQVRVHTAYREIQPDSLRKRLEQAVRLRMPWPASSVRLSNWRLPERFAVPIAAQRLVVKFRAGEDFLGHVVAQLTLLDALNPEAARVQRSVSVRVDVRLPVAVASRPLRRGEILAPNMLQLEERELRLLRGDVIHDLPQILGSRLRRRVAEGAPLSLAQLEAEPLVRRGDVVVVESGGPGLDVRIDARALEAGARGQVIRVENPATRRRFQAEVIESGSARLRAPGVGNGP